MRAASYEETQLFSSVLFWVERTEREYSRNLSSSNRYEVLFFSPGNKKRAHPFLIPFLSLSFKLQRINGLQK